MPLGYFDYSHLQCLHATLVSNGGALGLYGKGNPFAFHTTVAEKLVVVQLLVDRIAQAVQAGVATVKVMFFL